MDHRKTPAELLTEAAQAVRHLGWTWERIEAALPPPDAPGASLPELARRLGADLDRSDHRLGLLALLHHSRDISRSREPGGRALYRQRAAWERRAAAPRRGGRW